MSLISSKVFGMCLVGIIQDEISGCDAPSQDLAATSVEGVPSLLPALPSESSDVSGDEKVEKKSRLSLARNLKKEDSRYQLLRGVWKAQLPL